MKKTQIIRSHLIALLTIWLLQNAQAQSEINNSSIKIIGTSYLDSGDNEMILVLPDSILIGDVTLVFMGQSDSGSLKLPSGWQEISNWGRPGEYNDVNLKTGYHVYTGGTRQFNIGTHKKSLVYAITLRGADTSNLVIDIWTKNDTNNKYLNGDRGGCSRGSDGRAVAKSILDSQENGLHFVASMYDDPQRDIKIYDSDRYNRRVMNVLRSWHYGDDGLTVAVEGTQNPKTENRYFKGDVCRGGNAEGVVASFTIKPKSENPDNEDEKWVIDTCDNLQGWNSHNTISLSGTFQEGTNSVKSIGSGTDEFFKRFSDKDLSDATTLEFWYYISNLDGFGDSNQVELGSGGKNDLDEYSWDIDKSSLNEGWNSISLKLEDARTIGNPDLSRINWFRLYRKKSQSTTTRIDYIRMTNPAMVTDIIIDSCEELNNWKSHNPTLVLSSTSKEGNSSIKSIGSKTDEFYRVLPTKNVSGRNILRFWYFISSLDGLTDSNQVELGSGSRPDTDEFSWKIDRTKLNIGWNLIELNIEEASKIGNPDLSNINWFRLYRIKNASIITRIDDIRMIATSQNPILADSETLDKSIDFKIFPVPTQGHELNFYIKNQDSYKKNLTLSIRNTSGQVIYTKNIEGSNQNDKLFALDNLNLKPAVYFAEIKSYKSKKTIKFLVTE